MELKLKLVNELLRVTKRKGLPKIVREQFNNDYKMFLFTLSTEQIIESLEYENICNLDK
jgi:hypothetical protein|tara:strand:- start:1007 stop:1183 length:177 start_codon:yes stop_codon:yes gene_type:complete